MTGADLRQGADQLLGAGLDRPLVEHGQCPTGPVVNQPDDVTVQHGLRRQVGVLPVRDVLLVVRHDLPVCGQTHAV